ncbi:MAG: pantetheine-phosphate adenylyltransferase [Spirochaetales bacterium]|nr:pantetheine-phosphate adenylyltransferase [Spirochaetales bacterium]
MKAAVFPGSFDPMTNGHLDIVKRASVLFDKVYVAVGVNSSKTALFLPEERLELVRESVKDMENVEVCLIKGLVVTHAKELGAKWIIKGLRDEEDFRYEADLERNNKFIESEVETIYFSASRENISTRSSSIKEFIKYGVDVTGFLPKPFATVIKERFFSS